MRHRKLPIVERRGGWYADYCERGKRYRFFLGLSATAPVQSALKALETRKAWMEEERRLTGGRSPVELEAAFEGYLNRIGSTKAAATASRYRSALRAFREFLETRGVKFLHELRPEHIADFATSRNRIAGEKRTRRLTDAGLGVELRTIRAALNQFRCERKMPAHYHSRDWFKGLFPRVEKRRRIFSATEWAGILKTASDADRRLLQFLYLTAVRVGVALRLHGSHIGMDADGVKVILFPPGKRGKRHSLSMMKGVDDLVRTCPRRPGGYIFWQPEWGNVDDPADVQRAEMNLNHRLGRILAKLELEAGRIHDIRRTAATEFAKVMGPLQLQAVMGWSSLATAQSYYSPSSADLLEVMEKRSFGIQLSQRKVRVS